MTKHNPYHTISAEVARPIEGRTNGQWWLAFALASVAALWGFWCMWLTVRGIEYDYYYSCGPLAMLRNIHRTLEVDGQISLEERMGCGFGGCMGCSYKTRDSYRRVCTDTVVSARDILFD